MSEHTASPWATEAVSGFPVWVKGPDGVLIANCAVKRRPLEEDQANARLIAVAPELLKTLRETFEFLDHRFGNNTGDDWADNSAGSLADEIQQLIAKAEGAA